MKRIFVILLLLGARTAWAQELLLQLGHTQPITCLQWGPDGLLASGSEDGTAKVWDERGSVLATLTPEGKRPRLAYVGWLNGREVVTVTQRGQFSVYDWKTGAMERTWSCPGAREQVVGQGPRVALFTGEAVLVYAAGTGQVEGQFPLPPHFVAQRLALQGDRLAVSTHRGTLGQVSDVLRVYDLKSGAQQELPCEDSRALAFSPDGQALASADLHTITIHSLTGGAPRSFQCPSRIEGLCWPRADRLVELSNNSSDPDWTSWNPATGKLNGKGPDEGVSALAIEGDRLARAAGTRLRVDNWEGKTVQDLAGRCQIATSLYLVKDQLGIGLGSGQLLSWNLSSGSLQSRLQAQKAFVSDVAVSPDTRWLATCDPFNNRLHVLERESGKPVFEWNQGGSGGWAGVRMAAFGPDGEWLAVAKSAQVYLLRTKGWKIEQDFASPGECVGLCWQGPSRLSAVGGGGVQDWDVAGARALRTWKTSGQNLTCADRAPNGDLWMGCGQSAVLLLPAGAEEPLSLPTSAPTAVRGVKVGPDGRRVAVTGDSGIFDLFDASTRKPGPVHPQTHGVTQFDPLFLGDGHTLVARGIDYRVRFWDMEKELAALVVLDAGKNWVVAAPDGRFDGTPEGQRALEWRLGAERYRLDQFFERYFTPGLLKNLGQQGGPSVASAPKPPVLELDKPRVDGNVAQVQVKVTERGAGISHLRLFVNGHPLPEQPGTSWKAPLSAGINELRVTAFDASGQVESRGDWVRVQCQAADAHKPRLFVLACGIDRYPGKPLKFSRADALAMAGPFQAASLFESVKSVALLDEQATRAALLAALSDLSRQAEPQDTLVVFLSGHGSTVQEAYQYLCFDGQVVSSAELAAALEAIPAARQLLVLDTCHSGAASAELAARFVRGQQRLARGSGTFLLAASRSTESALEVPGLAHGLLTFSVLEGLRTAPLNPEQQLTANGLVQFASFEVDELARKYQAQQEVVQYSTGRDFPLLQR